VWILAAKHEMEVRRCMHAARGLLQQAIATNPQSQQLWLEVGTYLLCLLSLQCFDAVGWASGQ